MDLDSIPQSKAFKELMRAIEGPAEARGKREGKVEGKLEGEIEGQRAALVRYLDRRGVKLTRGQRASVRACDDLATLERWMDAAFTASSEDEIVTSMFGRG